MLFCSFYLFVSVFFFQAEAGIRDFCLFRGLGEGYKGKVIYADEEIRTVRVYVGGPIPGEKGGLIDNNLFGPKML